MITDARTGIAERVADRPALRLPVTETTAILLRKLPKSAIVEPTDSSPAPTKLRRTVLIKTDAAAQANQRAAPPVRARPSSRSITSRSGSKTTSR